MSTLISKTDLLKKFTIGFIPLLIFIIADEIFGTHIGLLAAIVVGIGEFIFYYVRYRRTETFILFDVLLIISLGTGSLSPGNAFLSQGYIRNGSKAVVGPMPPYGDIVESDDQIWEIIAWIRAASVNEER